MQNQLQKPHKSIDLYLGYANIIYSLKGYIKLKMKNLHTKIGIFASSALIAASAVYFYSPTFGSHAAESQSAEVSLTVASALGISTSADNLNLEANVGSFVHGSINVDVITNSQYGYTLTLEDSDDESSLVHTNTSVSDKLVSDFSGAKTSAAMDDNTWGFSLDESSYYFIPTLGNPVALKRTNAVHSGYDTTAVDFGAKVGTSLTAGTYKDTVKFTAYVNGVDGNPDTSNGGGSGSGGSSSSSINISEPGVKPAVADIHSISNMQDMSSAICAATTTPAITATEIDLDGSYRGNTNYVQRARLTDSRDGKTYLVSKLADGNCWMSQNLELELTAGTPITISNNDGTTSTATPGNTTQTTTGTKWTRGENQWRSYKLPAGQSYFYPGRSSSTPSGEGYEYDWQKAGLFYNWYAATAGTGTYDMKNGAVAPSSICPAGWKLPAGTGEKSYLNLIGTVYGFDIDNGNPTGIAALQSAPFNFNFPGAYRYNYGTTYGQSSNGHYWTSMSERDNDYSDSAVQLSLNSSEIDPDLELDKSYGYTVRCVAI